MSYQSRHPQPSSSAPWLLLIALGVAIIAGVAIYWTYKTEKAEQEFKAQVEKAQREYKAEQAKYEQTRKQEAARIQKEQARLAQERQERINADLDECIQLAKELGQLEEMKRQQRKK